MARRFFLFALLVFALTACEVRTHLNIDASDLTNGQIMAQVGFDEDFRQAMAEFGGGGDLLAEVEDSAPSEGWEVDRFTDGDIEGVSLTRSFSSIEELQEILSTSSIASGESGGWEEVNFTETDDTVRFEASLSAPGMEGMDEAGIEEMTAFLEFDFQIAVTFPGEVIEHNGVLEERTVVWDLDEDSLADAELFAEARKGGSFPWAIVGGVVLGLIVIGIVAWSVISRRRPPQEVAIVFEQPSTEPAEVVATEE